MRGPSVPRCGNSNHRAALLHIAHSTFDNGDQDIPPVYTEPDNANMAEFTHCDDADLMQVDDNRTASLHIPMVR